MKYVIVGGSGLIGSQVVNKLSELGHEVVAASPRSGVNAVTGEGLATALAGADVIVDVSNSPSFADDDVLEFFKASTTNLLAAEKTAEVKHHVAVSVVGADRLPDSGYMRAKVAQEELIKAGEIPYTILRATQFFEFLGAIAESNADGKIIHMPTALMQPVAAEDVAAAVANIALDKPQNKIVELGGPEATPLDELIRRCLAATNDNREVVTDPNARYFGTQLEKRSLVPDEGARIGKINFEQWYSKR